MVTYWLLIFFLVVLYRNIYKHQGLKITPKLAKKNPCNLLFCKGLKVVGAGGLEPSTFWVAAKLRADLVGDALDALVGVRRRVVADADRAVQFSREADVVPADGVEEQSVSVVQAYFARTKPEGCTDAKDGGVVAAGCDVEGCEDSEDWDCLFHGFAPLFVFRRENAVA